MDKLLQIVDAASTPLLLVVMLMVRKIMTNDLPHIYERICDVSNRLDQMEGSRSADVIRFKREL